MSRFYKLAEQSNSVYCNFYIIFSSLSIALSKARLSAMFPIIKLNNEQLNVQCCTYSYIVYHNQYTITIVLCIVGPLRPSKNSKHFLRIVWFTYFLNIYPLVIYADIHNMIVGFSILFVFLLLQYYSLTITTKVSSFIWWSVKACWHSKRIKLHNDNKYLYKYSYRFANKGLIHTQLQVSLFIAIWQAQQ